MDDQARTFLEKEVGVGRTAELAGQVDLWHFTTRYFRPLEKEELQVAVGPDGALRGFRHTLDETAPGARLGRDEALRRAEALRDELAPAGQWRLVEERSEEHPSRLDWRFTWERTDLRVAPSAPEAADEARARVEVVVQGDQPGELRQLLKVPEAWTRRYEAIRSANNLAETIDLVAGTLPLGLALLWVLVRRWARGDVRWRPALWLGGVGGVLAGAGLLNELPRMVASYPTSTPWEGFVAQTVLLAVLGGLGQGLLIGLAAAAGEPLYRAAFPRLLALAPGFTWRGALTRPGATALVVGALLAPVMAAYQVVYYAIGQAVGFWSPADLPYENIFSAPAPWLLPASVGYTAATFEEFTFRLFAIPLLAGLFARLVRRRGAALCAAIVVSAVVWAFLHSTYPQDPFFARGLEITLAGIAFGFLMVRFGILASLAVHYTFDAFDSALVLANANAPPTSLAAYAITAVPLAVGAFAFARAWRRGGFPSAGPLRNGALARAAAPAAAVRVAAPRAWVYERLSTRRRVAAGGLGVVGLAAALGLGGLTQEHPFAFGRAEAVARAAAAVRALGVDPAGWRAVATLESRSAEPAAAYLREVGGRAAVKELYGPFIPTTAWEVRFTRPRVADEYRVELLPDAAAADGPFAVAARLGETTPGGRLGEAEARWLALAYVATRPGWAGKTPLVVESSTQERPSRTDHALTLAQAGVWYGEAEARAELNVVGDQVSGYRPLVKLPEAWERARSATRVQDVAAIGLVGLFGLVVVGLAVARLVGLARAHRMPRRPALWAAGGFAALDLVGELNGLPLFFQGYETALPEETYAAGRLAGMVALLVLGAAVAGAVAPLLLALWRERFGAGLVPAAEARRDWGLDGALCGLVLPLAGLGVAGAAGALGVDLPLVRSAGTAGVATAAPFVAALAGLRWTLLGLAAGMAGYLIVRERVGGDRWALLLCGAAPVVAAVLARSPVEAAEACGGMLALLVAAAGAARWLLRANLLAYFVAAAAWALVGAAVPLVQARDAFLAANGVALLVVCGLGLSALVAQRCTPAPRSAPPGAEVAPARW